MSHKHNGCCSSGHDHDECHDHGHSCHSHDSSCGDECEEHGDFASVLLELADEAWMDVLKSKIIQHIEHHSGHELEKLARITSESNHQRWKNKLAVKRTKHDFRDKLLCHFKNACCGQGQNGCSTKHHQK